MVSYNMLSFHVRSIVTHYSLNNETNTPYRMNVKLPLQFMTKRFDIFPDIQNFKYILSNSEAVRMTTI